MNAKRQADKDFSRPLLVDRVPRKGSHEVIKADPSECAMLAQRFDLPNLFALNAHFVVMPWRGGGLKVTGSVDADVEQRSVVSLETFRHAARFTVERYFLAAKNI